MPIRKLSQPAAFFMMALAIYLFRDTQSGALAFIAATAIVILFWVFHSLRFAFTSFLNIFVLVVGFGVILYGFADHLPFLAPESKASGWQGLDMNPGMIGRLKDSHELALEIEMDHHPSEDERYYRTGIFKETTDGLHYFIQKSVLDQRLMPESRSWAERELTSKDLPSQIATVEKWWRQAFTYSQNPGVFKGEHPLDDFLFARKIGFCEHYAAALTTLLKLSGTDARVAVGFSGGSWNPLLRKLTFEDADAHAWVEALDPATKHWKRIDPTLWVSPGENTPRTNVGMEIVVALLAFFILSGLFFAYLQNQDPAEKFLKKLAKLEKKNQLLPLGLTIAERIQKIIFMQPAVEKMLRATLSEYLDVYFRSEPTAQSKRRLSRSLSKW